MIPEWKLKETETERDAYKKQLLETRERLRIFFGAIYQLSLSEEKPEAARLAWKSVWFQAAKEMLFAPPDDA